VEYLILFALVFGINLLPAFAPPTWSIIVLYGLNSDMPLPAIVGIGALAAASGRYSLARGFRAFGHRLSDKTRRNLAAVRAAFERHRRGGLIALAAFAFSPLSSAQLFAAAGLAAVPLLAFTAAFFAGRLLSYSFYAASAKALQHSSIGESFGEVFSSPLGIAVQVLLLAALVAFTRINWERILGPAPEHAEKPGRR
jgi:membrane protein DedA with SNARE-associated domain